MMLDTNPMQRYVRDYSALLLEGCVWFDGRKRYLEVMGKEAPAYDPSKRVKKWLLTELHVGPLTGRIEAMVLARDSETGEVLALNGKPYLLPYSFSLASAQQVNIPTGVANEPRVPGGEAWLPLRGLEDYEHLEFAKDLVNAGMAGPPFVNCEAYLVDDRYQPKVPEADEPLGLRLERIEKKIDGLRELLERLDKTWNS